MRFLKISSIIYILIFAGIYGWNNLFISEQNREVVTFNSIYTSGPINVYISQASEESISIRSDSNILNSIVTEVINGELKIYNNRRIEHERVLDVYVNYKALDSIHAATQSTLTGKGLLNATKLKIKASDISEIKLQMRVDSLDLVMDDRANVQLAGFTDKFNLLITDVGDLMAYNFVSKHCKAIIDTGDQSPGIARINVSEVLDATIIGPRNLKYKGDPIVTNKYIDGKGKLINH